jgi:hypothetical protein
MRLALHRFMYHEEATLGRLYFQGGWCYTLEDPWRANATDVSCIPEGWYALARGTFKGIYSNFGFTSVPGRTAVEIHKGNTDRDTHGCVLLGSQVTFDEAGHVSMANSTQAFDRFMRTMAGVNACWISIEREAGPVAMPFQGDGGRTALA